LNIKEKFKSLLSVSYPVLWHMTKIVDNFNLPMKSWRPGTALFQTVINDFQVHGSKNPDSLWLSYSCSHSLSAIAEMQISKKELLH
jgi:hypothetical protein